MPENDRKPQVLNYYACPRCKYDWHELWACNCDSMCPSCGQKNIQTTDSEELRRQAAVAVTPGSRLHDRGTRDIGMSVLMSDWDKDPHDRASPVRQVIVEPNSQGLELHFKGFGCCGVEEGYAGPVYIEYRDGVPHVLVWADINSEEPTHSISLAGASESLRAPEQDNA